MSVDAPSWTAELGQQEQEQVRELVERARRADGVEPVGDDVLRALARSSQHLRITDGGALLGYAHLEDGGDTPVGELVVHPEHRRRGHGRTLLDAVLSRGGDGTRVWAHGDGEGARALAAATGLTGVRDLLQLRRELAGAELAEPAPREDVHVRTYAGPADDAALLRVNNEAFSWHPEQGGWGQAEIDERTAESWFDPEGLFLATDADDGELLGFHWTKVHPATADEPALGEVYVVGISPSAQGRGLGRLLTLTGLRHLRDAGLGAVVLYVEGDNTAALHTYERLGFTRFHLDRAYARSPR